eukprot:TRINITY_DN1259_c1_g4_i6.p3 TRINITY_DN1259_c1_g4~~TRINITY_DN1259_c1_g4_i6.p3  ORF type:complete len:101 (-),score=13.81 TRINITY_DN1259_c1_g4_i6:359-661(-)
MIIVQVDFQAVDGQIEKFKEIALEARKITLQEKGCIKYNLHTSLHDPNLICLYEEWEDMDALKEHAEKDHTKNMVGSFQEGGGKVTINVYEANKVQFPVQ